MFVSAADTSHRAPTTHPPAVPLLPVDQLREDHHQAQAGPWDFRVLSAVLCVPLYKLLSCCSGLTQSANSVGVCT